MSTTKRLLEVHGSPEAHWVGDGFPVHTIFSFQSLGQEISPFLLLDHAGPAEFSPTDEPRGVEEHPHRGFETVTIVYQGELEHRDSAGNQGRIGPGDVQWMTAGSGILHEEKHAREFARQGGTLEMAQLWVNLPAKHKMTAPAYQTILASQIPAVPLSGSSGTVRVIAGEFEGGLGPARTFTPLGVCDLRMNKDARTVLALPGEQTTLLAVLRGRVSIHDMETVGGGNLALFEKQGDAIGLHALEETMMLLLTGEPINEPIVGYGPFVMNTEDEIRHAIADYRSGRFGQRSA